MKKSKPNKINPRNKKEKGITLIALIVAIIILLILAAVAVRGITGNEGLIKATSVAAEDYKITAYGEKLEQTVQAVVLEYAVKGEEPTTSQIAEELEKQTDWIKSAVPNVETGEIIVT